MKKDTIIKMLEEHVSITNVLIDNYVDKCKEYEQKILLLETALNLLVEEHLINEQNLIEDGFVEDSILTEVGFELAKDNLINEVMYKANLNINEK